MEEKSFETHCFGSRPLPFGFHFDTHARDLKENLSMHWHPNIELLYFTNGSGRVFCGTQDYDVSAGDLFIVNANLPHAIASEELVQYYCLIIDQAFCLENGIDTDNAVFKTLLKERRLSALFEAVIKEYQTPQPYKNAGVRAAVLNLMVYIARTFREPREKPGQEPLHDEGMRRALGFITAHINEKLSLEQVAEKAGRSKYYFLREFKKMTGETVVSYMNKTRCENAKILLKTGRYTIQEVCEKTGFEDVSYFSKNFKRYTGQTPSFYLKSQNRLLETAPGEKKS